jgi:cyclopropane-fatty-acyl-phospholipid synthase
MRSQIFTGKVMHARLKPIVHQFQYSIYWYALDLDELTQFSQTTPLFAYNRAGVVSLYDTDYLDGTNRPLKQRALEVLRNSGCFAVVSTVTLITSARYFGYVFNPVSFYYFYDAAGVCVAHMAEVNNTFNERHLYILHNPTDAQGKASYVHYQVPKDFHVSPFNKIEGDYAFFFSPISDTLDIKINIVADDTNSFVSRMWGSGRTLTTATIAATILRFPITAALSIPRIYWQAAKLHYQRGLPVIPKPNPISTNTIKVAPPTWKERLGLSLARKLLGSMNHGRITVTYPEGHTESFGNPSSYLHAHFTLKNYYVFEKLMKHGSIGFGESYMDGDWETDDLGLLLAIILNNSDTIDERYFNINKPLRLINRVQHWFRRNTLVGSKKNIEAHYDLSNDLFKLFLDPSLMYSSALYPSPHATLEEAQQHKVNTLIEKAAIERGHSVLEIGSGWGTVAITAAQKRDCTVKSITLSKEQQELAQERALACGVQDAVTFDLIDYRHVSGTYDRIISVEMLEAVGKEYLGSFFASCERLLKPNGIVVLQAIATPESWYDIYCSRQDWIQKHIFPGSHIPCLAAILDAVKNHSNFMVEHIQNIAPDYARTLREWRVRFNAQSSAVTKLGFDERFKKMWNFYLASCEAEFATRWLGVYQIVLTRPNNHYLVARDQTIPLFSDVHKKGNYT